MTCQEIENRLPAYLDDLLSPEEGTRVTEHLASCPDCSRALADLNKAQQLLQSLEEVEPPPFFEQRIMSRVRQEAAQKRGILWRLFHPLYINVPLQALATLLVAVLAFHVYQQGEPEMKQTAQLSLPGTELAKEPVTAEPPKPTASASAAAPVGQAPAGNISEKAWNRSVASLSDRGGKGDRAAGTGVPVGEDRPSAMQQADPVAAAAQKESPTVGAEGLSRAQTRTAAQDVEKAKRSLREEKKGQETLTDTAAAAGESRKAMSAPSPTRRSVAAAEERSIMNLTIQVGDRDVAIREIETWLSQVNGQIIEREHRQGGDFLKARIAARNIEAFLDLLEAIGRVNLETGDPAHRDGNVTVVIHIFSHP